TEINEAFKRSVFRSFTDDIFNCTFTDTFDGPKTETNTGIPDNVKEPEGFIHIWRKNLDIEFFRFLDIGRDLFLVVDLSSKKCSKELRRIIFFQEGRLVGHH